jgi:PIN domain nuclease of toxin-antitoxin system
MVDAPAVPQRVRRLLTDPANEFYLSVVSSWEIALKYSSGRLPLPVPPVEYVPSRRRTCGIRSLPLEEETTLELPRLPNIHSDPFDRMLICQAIVHDLPILTPDPRIAQYPVRVVW